MVKFLIYWLVCAFIMHVFYNRLSAKMEKSKVDVNLSLTVALVLAWGLVPFLFIYTPIVVLSKMKIADFKWRYSFMKKAIKDGRTDVPKDYVYRIAKFLHFFSRK